MKENKNSMQSPINQQHNHTINNNLTTKEDVRQKVKNDTKDKKETKPSYLNIELTPKALDLLIYSLKQIFLLNSSILMIEDVTLIIKNINICPPLKTLLKENKIEVNSDNIDKIKVFVVNQNNDIKRILKSFDVRIDEESLLGVNPKHITKNEAGQEKN